MPIDSRASRLNAEQVGLFAVGSNLERFRSKPSHPRTVYSVVITDIVETEQGLVSASLNIAGPYVSASEFPEEWESSLREKAKDILGAPIQSDKRMVTVFAVIHFNNQIHNIIMMLADATE